MAAPSNNTADAMDYPIEDIKWLLHACRADEALAPHDRRYYNFTALRGGHSVVIELADCFEQALPSNAFHHRLLCGHRGSGKTTELLCLKDWADRSGFLSLWMDIYEYFGPSELHYSDLYLIAAEAVYDGLRELEVPLPDGPMKAVIEWFAKVVKEDKESTKSDLSLEGGAEVSSGIPLLGKLFAKFNAKKQGSVEHLQTARREIRQDPHALIELTNQLLTTANTQLAKERSNGLLLIFDSLDRYEAENIRRLLHDSTMLRSLGCHVVYTMPISLMYDAKVAYWDTYEPPVVLPMLALRGREDSWQKTVTESSFNEAAVSEMLEALKLRIKVDTLFQNADDARLLVKMSGGCMRDLLHLVNLARSKSRRSLDAPLTHLTSEGIQDAIDEYRLTLTEGLEGTDYQWLARIARHKQMEDILEGPVPKFLNRRNVLRYAKGGNRWSDVHPVVIETKGFQNAFADSATVEAS